MLIHVPDDPEEAAAVRAAIIADGRLTFGALGLLLVLLDHAPEWRVNIDTLASWARQQRGRYAEGPETVRVLFAELLAYGYLAPARPSGGDGKSAGPLEVFAVPQAARDQDEGHQVVYVIGQPGRRVVKIGTTSNLHARLRSLQTASPVRLEVLWAGRGGRRLEAWLHNELESLRLEGEWFDFRDEEDPGLSVIALVEKARRMGIE